QGEENGRAGEEHLMAWPSMGSGVGSGSPFPPSEWQSSRVYTRSQLMACLRAGLIALVLLAVLALIVLY
ncbi:hypothetical protein C6A85_58510, partial [Mycobacterium sp. ITM-2017-0098]